jgi:hypothetical protein
MTRLTLRRVHYMPKELESGILYVSEEFDVAVHLCACGCGNKVVTPLGPAEWSFAEAVGGPSLTPSIGNWQLPCKSHYWIDEGKVEWSTAWSARQIERGRHAEEERRLVFYESREAPGPGRLAAAWRWFRRLGFWSK